MHPLCTDPLDLCAIRFQSWSCVSDFRPSNTNSLGVSIDRVDVVLARCSSRSEEHPTSETLEPAVSHPEKSGQTASEEAGRRRGRGTRGCEGHGRRDRDPDGRLRPCHGLTSALLTQDLSTASARTPGSRPAMSSMQPSCQRKNSLSRMSPYLTTSAIPDAFPSFDAGHEPVARNVDRKAAESTKRGRSGSARIIGAEYARKPRSNQSP